MRNAQRARALGLAAVVVLGIMGARAAAPEPSAAAKQELEGKLQTDAGYIPLATLMAGDALKLINEAKGGGPPFYAESWALRRWFRTAAPDDVRERFTLWETMCRGAALGAQAGKPNQGDVSPAMDAFTRLLGPDMVKLEPQFRAWLRTL